VLSSKTRRTNNRAASLLRLAAVSVGRTDTALGAFYRRLSARVGKAKAITATARKIAVLFYNTLAMSTVSSPIPTNAKMMHAPTWAAWSGMVISPVASVAKNEATTPVMTQVVPIFERHAPILIRFP
jgi:uncharacterized membrane protein